MRESSYVVLDIETTGLRPGRHGITEVYAAKVDGRGQIKGEFHSLCNPGRLIPRFITKLTGISDEMVRDAPKQDVVIRNLDAFIDEQDVIVGHNVRFDMSFLDHARSITLGEPFVNESLCTLLLARRAFSSNPLPSYRLGTLAQLLEISTEGAHRAKKDVEMTIAVKQEIFRKLEEVNIKKKFDVLKLQRLPLKKAACLFTC